MNQQRKVKQLNNKALTLCLTLKIVCQKWHEYNFMSNYKPALLASMQATLISSFSSRFSLAMASPTVTNLPTARLTAWPTRWMACRVLSERFGLSLWLMSVVI